MNRSAFDEVLACIAAALFNIVTGLVIGFSAIFIPQLEAPNSDIKVSTDDISWIASVITLTTPVSAFITGYVMDKIGRLNTMRLATLPYVAGWICIGLADNLTWIIVGRILSGSSLAIATNPSIVYITEVSRPDYRGALVCLSPSLISLGTVVMYAMGAYIHWRTISWIAIAFCLPPLLLTGVWAPESPPWLISRGRTEDALKSLTFLLRKDKRAGLAEQQLAELLKEHNAKKGRADQRGSAISKLIRAMVTPVGYKPVILLTIVFSFEQFSGIYIIMFYSVTFLENIGATVDPFTSSVIVGLVRLFVGIITSFLLNKFGRRPLFLFSSFGMAVAMIVSGYFTKEIMAGHMERNPVPVICILVYITVSVIGLMTIPWTMTGELFAIEIRGMAQSLMSAIGTLLMFASLKTYPFMDDVLGGPHAVQWFFAVVALGGFVFIFVFLPETHGKTLAEIQEYLKYNTIYITSKDRKPKSPIKEGVEEEMVNLKKSDSLNNVKNSSSELKV